MIYIIFFIGLICFLWTVQKVLKRDNWWAWKALAYSIGACFGIGVIWLTIEANWPAKAEQPPVAKSSFTPYVPKKVLTTDEIEAKLKAQGQIDENDFAKGGTPCCVAEGELDSYIPMKYHQFSNTMPRENRTAP